MTAINVLPLLHQPGKYVQQDTWVNKPREQVNFSPKAPSFCVKQ